MFNKDQLYTNVGLYSISERRLLYDEDILLLMASMIGKPFKIDFNTSNVACGRFARVCVEINLAQLVCWQSLFRWSMVQVRI